jgi:hypothetical protein
MWLLKTLTPDHNTISNFRRDNPKAIKKVFRATVEIAKHFELIGGNLLAGDSTKFRAQISLLLTSLTKILIHFQDHHGVSEEYLKDLVEKGVY